jgi:hypothetical protein
MEQLLNNEKGTLSLIHIMFARNMKDAKELFENKIILLPAMAKKSH